MASSSRSAFARLDVVVVPFPFTDKAAVKRRSALVLSDADAFDRAAGHSVMAVITSVGNAPWPLDVTLRDPGAAGLSSASLVRMKLFTLDHRFVLRKAGRLSAADPTTVEASLAALLAPRARRPARDPSFMGRTNRSGQGST